MHGNVWTWCQESAWGYKEAQDEKPALDEEDKRDISDRLTRVLRGGSFIGLPANVRSAFRYNYRPSVRLSFGVRPARTL